jgi:hypothetical protein
MLHYIVSKHLSGSLELSVLRGYWGPFGRKNFSNSCFWLVLKPFRLCTSVALIVRALENQKSKTFPAKSGKALQATVFFIFKGLLVP